MITHKQPLKARGLSLAKAGWLVPLFVAAQSLGLPQVATAAGIDFTDCGNGSACPYVAYGDAQSYSLAVNAILWDAYQGGGTGPGNPFYVTSTAGAIKNEIVVATGASGSDVTTNFAGMDNAYPTPNTQSGKVFFTTNKTAYGLTPPGTGNISAPADPVPTPTFSNDNPDTWDTTIAALSSFLGTGNTPVFFFNNNQINSGAATNQDLAVWAQLTLSCSDPSTSGCTATQNKYFVFNNTNVDNATNPGPYSDPGGGVLNGTVGTGSSTSSSPDAGTNSSTDYVLSGGQLCYDPNTFQMVDCSTPGAITVNNNLGANQAAYAIVFPGLNDILTSSPGAYDRLSLDLRMGCDPNTPGFPSSTGTSDCVGRSLNDGYEQLFITSQASIPQVPEPGTLALVGLGLLGVGLARRKKAA